MAGIKITDQKITELGPNEIFVFGSNLDGHHAGGAAKLAHKEFGAEWGKGIGMTGNCYAIPTMFNTVDFIKDYVDTFINHAARDIHKTYLVTEIGCGIAGFTPEQVAPLFKEAIHLDNVHLPKSFWKIILFQDCLKN